MLSHMPLDINTLMEKCSERLTEEIVVAMWEGMRRVQQGEVAWIAALDIASQHQPSTELLQKISQEETAKQQ